LKPTSTNSKERRKSYVIRPKEKGQGLVEYALILVLVAIVVIAVLMLLGPIIATSSAPSTTASPALDNLIPFWSKSSVGRQSFLLQN